MRNRKFTLKGGKNHMSLELIHIGSTDNNTQINERGNPVVIDDLQGGVPFNEIKISGKNLISYPYSETTKTVNGITFTDNGDGTVTANGTATANASFFMSRNFGFKNECDYFLSGCPSGGGLNTYYINWYQNHTGVEKKNYNDYGDGVKIPYKHIFSENNSLAIVVISGTVCDNLVFQPQIETGDTATEYEPPITGRELTVGVSGKNLLKYPYAQTTRTSYGVTFTDNGDGSITASGTHDGGTKTSYFGFSPWWANPNGGRLFLPKGNTVTFRVMGLPNTYQGMIAVKKDNTSADAITAIYATGESVANYTAEQDCYIACGIYGSNLSVGQAVNFTAYPQLELGETATAYEPYHGAEYTITPDSNPYTVPDDIRQQDGLNVVTASAGELSIDCNVKNSQLSKIIDMLDRKSDENSLKDHIDNKDNPHKVTKEQVGLGNVPNVTTNDQTPTYTEASTNTKLTSGEKLSVAFGKIAKAVSSLISHFADKVSHITAEERTSWNSKAEGKHNHTKSEITDFPDKLPADGGDADTVNGHTVESDVPENAKFTDTVYTHPASGVTAGTYKSVTVDVNGHVTAGTNPTTLAGYGITDAAAKSHTHDDRYYTESEINTKLNSKLDNSLKGATNGLAELDENGRVPSSQLPSYVDDVLEYSAISKFPTTGETGKIYVDTATNKTYRWSGTKYTEISPSLALGETSSTAYRGDRGKIAYDHSQTAHAPVNAEPNVQSDWSVTDTTSDAYIKNKPGNATTSAAGLMSSSDKKILDLMSGSALTSNGTTATTTKGYTYGVAGVTTSPYTYTKWYVYLDSGITTLTNGMIIRMKIPVGGCDFGVCITIDGTNFHPVIYNVNTTLKTHFAVNSELMLMYDSGTSANVWSNSPTSAPISGVWRMMNTYDYNSDYRVTQNNSTSNSAYRLLLSYSADDTNTTNISYKSKYFSANPSTGAFYANGYNRYDITGKTLDINTLNLSAGSPHTMHYIEKTSGGAANITNIPLTGQPFILDVELVRWGSTTDYITLQTFTSISDANNIYRRWCNSGTWRSWSKFVGDHTHKSADITDRIITTAVDDLNWGTVDEEAIPTISTIAWWNGAYSNNKSNLAYCNKGAFGDMATKSSSSYYTNTDLRLRAPKSLSTTNAEDFVMIYIDSVNGNDSNSGTNTSSPLKTFNAAVLKYKGDRELRIYLRDGTYTFPDYLADFNAIRIIGASSGTTANSDPSKVTFTNRCVIGRCLTIYMEAVTIAPTSASSFVANLYAISTIKIYNCVITSPSNSIKGLYLLSVGNSDLYNLTINNAAIALDLCGAIAYVSGLKSTTACTKSLHLSHGSIVNVTGGLPSINTQEYTLQDSASRLTIDGVDVTTTANNVVTASCTTAAATQVKVITLDDSRYTLKNNDILGVKFTYSNSYSSTTDNPITFSIGGESYRVYRNESTAASGRDVQSFGKGGYSVYYRVDSTNHILVAIFHSWDDNTTYSPQSLGFGYGTCTTAETDTAKVATLSGYNLVTNSVVSIKFSNNVPASATLNINSKGAKPIYQKGAAIDDGIIRAGDTATFIYNGSQYHLISVDRMTPLRANVGAGSTAPTNGGYYKAFTITQNKVWDTCDMLLQISSLNLVNNAFVPYLVTLQFVNGSDKVTPRIYCNYNTAGYKAYFNDLYFVYDPTSPTTDMEVWYKNPNAYSAISIAILSVNKRDDVDAFNKRIVTYSMPASQSGFTSGLTAKSFSSLELPSYYYTQTGCDMDNLISGGTHVVYGTDTSPVTNGPVSSGAIHMIVDVYVHTAGWIRQIAHDVRSTNTYTRSKLNGTWSDWVKIARVTDNVASATKLATARTIALAGAVTGSTTFDGTANRTITVVRRSCRVGQSGKTTTNPYYKFASCTTKATNNDDGITFKVCRRFGDNSTSTGIVTAHYRTGSTAGTFSSGELVWEYADSGIDPAKFFFCYKATSGTDVIVELYVKIDAAYTFYHFDVLQEGNRAADAAYWTLYNASSAGQSSALPSGYTSITSTLSTIKNSISGNADTVDGKHATDFASSTDPSIEGEIRLLRSGNSTIIPTIFAWEETIRLRAKTDDSSTNTYTDLIVTPDGIFTERMKNGSNTEGRNPLLKQNDTLAVDSGFICTKQTNDVNGKGVYHEYVRKGADDGSNDKIWRTFTANGTYYTDFYCNASNSAMTWNFAPSSNDIPMFVQIRGKNVLTERDASKFVYRNQTITIQSGYTNPLRQLDSDGHTLYDEYIRRYTDSTSSTTFSQKIFRIYNSSGSYSQLKASVNHTTNICTWNIEGSGSAINSIFSVPSSATISGGAVRNISSHTSDPVDGSWSNGDIWFTYS